MKKESMTENKLLYDVSMSYVESGWQDRYEMMVGQIKNELREKYSEYFSDLQLYRCGPMNYVVVAVYYEKEGVQERLKEILSYVSATYQREVGRNVRRKQILKFDHANKIITE